MNPAFTPIFDPLTFKHSGVTLANRIVAAPMTTWSSNPDGTISDDELSYIKRRSKGLGAWITSCAYVINHGKAFSGQWAVSDDKYLSSLRSVADAIHSVGTKAIIQIHHGGRLCPVDVVLDTDIALSASAVPSVSRTHPTPVPRAMTSQEVEDTVRAFGNATRLAIEAGFDGVEIHGANMYLLQQFFSPQSNLRDDQWGGDFERRLAFPLAILAAVKAAVSEHAKTPFIIGYRLSPEEAHSPGITLDDTYKLIDRLVELGLDYIHVSTWDFFHGSVREDWPSSSARTPIAQLVKQRVGDRVAVIGVGLVHEPSQVVDILQRGVDGVALGRALLKEPDWMEKVQTGQEATLRREFLPTREENVIPVQLWGMLSARF